MLSDTEQIQPVRENTPPLITQYLFYTKQYAYFNFLFAGLFVVECLLFFIFFSFLLHSSILAANLALIFATGFAYFLLRVHYQARKFERIYELVNMVQEEFMGSEGDKGRTAEGRVALANCYTKLAKGLQGAEYRYYQLPKLAEMCNPLLSRLSSWMHWHDIFKMKEILLLHTIQEYIELVKKEPTSLELHAALANAYVILSGLYNTSEQSDLFRPSSKLVKLLEERFTWASKRAIEEFKILSQYAPNDPWVHQQLAYSYHDLKMPAEEIREYEELLKLKPRDSETFFKLGVLYFEQGKNAEGLAIYKQLLQFTPQKARALIQHYGSYNKL